MAHSPRKHRSRYDDPYTFDDPYIKSPPSAHNLPAYTYIGTDEPLTPRPGSPSRRTSSPDRNRARRNARTTSPPRHSRRHRAPTPSPPTSQHRSSPRPKDRPRDRSHDNNNIMSRGKHFYHGFVENNPKLQHYGKRGLSFMGEAAAAYAAAHAGEEAEEHVRHSPRGRSEDHGDRHDRSRRRHRHYSSSPSRSPSPPRRRHSTRHGDHDRDHDRDHHRRRQHNASPPPHSRDPGRSQDPDRSRGRRHHRYSSSPSPSPSRRRRHSRSRRRNNTAPPSKPSVDRWQMAARAALEAGGLTAYRLRKEPGSWTGGKAAKIATAALGAAALDAFMDQDPRSAKRGLKGMAENAVSSLIASQIMGRASKSKSR